MKLFSTIWQAIAHPPAPEAVRQKLLHQSQLDRIDAMATAESLNAQASAYHHRADMLKKRIERLQSEAEHAA